MKKTKKYLKLQIANSFLFVSNGVGRNCVKRQRDNEFRLTVKVSGNVTSNQFVALKWCHFVAIVVACAQLFFYQNLIFWKKI